MPDSGRARRTARRAAFARPPAAAIMLAPCHDRHALLVIAAHDPLPRQAELIWIYDQYHKGYQ
jgi:hypothetical protein